MGFGVWGLGFRVWGLGFRVWGLGSRASRLPQLSERAYGSSSWAELNLKKRGELHSWVALLPPKP